MLSTMLGMVVVVLSTLVVGDRVINDVGGDGSCIVVDIGGGGGCD